MKIYPKEYEDYYTKPELLTKFNKQNIEIDGLDFALYQKQLTATLRQAQLITFDYLIKIFWLVDKFMVKGERKNFFSNTIDCNYYFSIFAVQIMNMDLKFILASNYFKKIMSYFSVWFPELRQSNPFESVYEFPYQNISFEHLVYVANMEEKIELIEIAEKEKMPYPKFYDYVINYVNCLNSELGYEKYYLRKYYGNNIQYDRYDIILVNQSYEKA